MQSRHQTSGDALEDLPDEFESAPPASGAGGTQDEVEEMEAAAELLEITNESELDQFIGGLLKQAARKVGSAIPPSVLRPLAHSLKAALKHTLPIVGGASGAALASSTGSNAARTLAAAEAYGLELEGLGVEDQEFELARRFVRLTRAAGRRAPRFARRVPPRVAVRRTLVTAARRYAPGLLRRRRRRRRVIRYRRPRFATPAPVVYTDPEPILEPVPVVDTEPDSQPEPPPAPEPDTDPNANGDASADADATTNADAEPATEEAAPARANCTCGGRCTRSRSQTSGRWAREGAHLVLQDT